MKKRIAWVILCLLLLSGCGRKGKPLFEPVYLYYPRVEFDYGSADTKEDLETIIEKLDSASKLQTNVDTLNTQLKEEKSAESEEIGFAPKSTFLKVLGLYEKIRDDKVEKAEDAINQGATDALAAAEAYRYLASQIQHNEED